MVGSIVNAQSPLSVTFDLSLVDHRAMVVHLTAPRRLNRSPSYAVFLVGTIAIMFIAVSLGQGLAFGSGMVVAFFLFALYFWNLQGRSRRLFAPRPNGYVLCHYVVALAESGVRLSTPHWSGETLWSAVLAVEETTQHIFLRLDTLAAHTIPKAAFPDPDGVRRFVSLAQAYVEAADRHGTSPAWGSQR